METVAGIQIVQGEWTECYGTLPVRLREENLTLKIQPNTRSLTHSLKQYRGIQSPLSKRDKIWVYLLIFLRRNLFPDKHSLCQSSQISFAHMINRNSDILTSGIDVLWNKENNTGFIMAQKKKKKRWTIPLKFTVNYVVWVKLLLDLQTLGQRISLGI